jgi:hypothetical protein
MNVLDFVRATVDEETLFYANPLWITIESIIRHSKNNPQKQHLKM